MFRRSKFALGLWVIAIAMLAVRVGGAHVHLCADGKEPAISVHVFEDVPHHAPGQTLEGHQDSDVSISAGVALLKKVDSASDLLPLLLVFLVVALLPRSKSRVMPSNSLAAPLSLLFHLRPPLRGPPL